MARNMQSHLVSQVRSSVILQMVLIFPACTCTTTEVDPTSTQVTQHPRQNDIRQTLLQVATAKTSTSTTKLHPCDTINKQSTSSTTPNRLLHITCASPMPSTAACGHRVLPFTTGGHHALRFATFSTSTRSSKGSPAGISCNVVVRCST